MQVKPKKQKTSIIIQVAIFFLIGVAATGFLTYYFNMKLYNESVTRQTEQYAAQIAEETKRAVQEFPAAEWLIRYWYEHPDTLEIEYDAELRGETQTAEKYRAFSERHPELELRYLNLSQVAALPEEAQQLYAETAYSWLICSVCGPGSLSDI